MYPEMIEKIITERTMCDLKNQGLKVGSVVRITKKHVRGTFGWQHPHMDRCIGKEGVVTCVHEDRVFVLNWNFLIESIELIKP